MNKPESRFARHRRIAVEVYREPRTLRRHLREGFVAVWISRGGGFYGLGWMTTFLVLELQFFASEVAESEGVFEFLGGQVIEYLLRFGLMSVVNSFQALIWPAFVLQWLGGYGIALLIGGYFGFEKVLRPLVEDWFPELADARRQTERRKAEKLAKKAAHESRRGKEPDG